MRDYEITIIVDPVLSGEEIKATAQTYVDMLGQGGSEIVYVNEMGLRTLAYPINKRNSGVYYCIEFRLPEGELIDNVELALRRDERIMRYLTVKLDKYGVKYNEDKRNGLIGKAKKHKQKKEAKDDRKAHEVSRRRGDAPPVKARPATAEKPAAAERQAPAEKPAPVEKSTPAPKAAPPVAVVAEEEE